MFRGTKMNDINVIHFSTNRFLIYTTSYRLSMVTFANYLLHTTNCIYCAYIVLCVFICSK